MELNETERLALMQVATALLVDATGDQTKLHRLGLKAGVAFAENGTYAALSTVFDHVAGVYAEKRHAGPQTSAASHQG